MLFSLQANKRTARSATKAPIKTTTDDTPDFDRGKVSLEIPDPLFGSSFSTVTNVSKIFGDLIMVSYTTFKVYAQSITCTAVISNKKKESSKLLVSNMLVCERFE